MMDRVSYNGWEDCVRLSNGRIEAIVTTVVGPRVVRFGFCEGANVFATMADEQGGQGEEHWCLRGGHRLWLAPEEKPLTYELDNRPVEAEEIEGGVRIRQPAGALSGCVKEWEMTMASDSDRVRVVHRIRNTGSETRRLAPWALSVMAPGGIAVIPLPRKVPHTESLLPNQTWSIWSYTDFADGRWTLGRDFILFRQDPNRGPGKLGIALREGWAAYQLGQDLFVKRFAFDETATYPDGGVNFEVFSNETFLEVESLGGLVDLAPGEETSHEELWELYNGTEPVVDEESASRLPPARS